VIRCHGVSWYIATVSGKIPVFGIRGISGDIPEETKRDRLDHAMQSETDQRVDEGKQSRARRKQFEWYKWIMQDTVEKAHTVLRKLLRHLGVVCSFYLTYFYSRYSGSNEAYLNDFCSKITNASSMDNYLKDKKGP
jgi:hypothetical protein